MAIDVSVVVPTYRRQKLLADCLAALNRQSLDHSAYEVIVADDANEPATQVLVAELSTTYGPPLRYIGVGPSHGPAAARNQGWWAARGRIIAFTDDDCRPDADWLRAGVAAIEAGADAACGHTVVPLPAEPTDYERDVAGLERGEFITANCFCRREALEAVGGFDERFTAAWREDSDLQFSLLEKGFRIVRAADAVVLHPVRPAPWGISLQQQRKAMFNALLYKKHPQLYRQRIPSPPRHYLATCAAGMAAATGAFSGIPAVALAGIGVWTVLTGRFFVKRMRGAKRSADHVAELLVTSALIPPLSLYWHFRGLWKFRVMYV